MKRDSFWRIAILSGLTFLLVAAAVGRAQQSSVTLANPVLQGADFSFEILAADLPSCVVESASGVWGEWTELAINPQSPFVVRVGQASRFFRVRCGDVLSSNVAGYFVQIIPRGYSMIANPLDQGRNTLAEIFQNPPPGTLLYKFDAVGQAWSAASQFEFGAWTHPNVTLARGEGAFVYAAVQFRHVYHGLCPARPVAVSLHRGWNLISSTAPAATMLDLIGFDRRTEVGETVYFYRGPTEFKVFVSSTYLGPGHGWLPASASAVNLGESFWYSCECRSPIWPGPLDTNSSLPRPATVYFNNHGPHTDLPFVGPDGIRLEGTNWAAQLYASTNVSGPFAPIGDSLSFLTGAAAGYLDTRPGALRVLPFVPSGHAFWGQVRFWERRSGANWEEAAAKGGLHWFREPVLTSTRLSPQSPPQILNLEAAAVALLDVNAWPTHQIAFEGGKARFVSTAPTNPGVSFQWQRLLTGTTWADLPGATSYDVEFNPAAVRDAGTYRLETINQGFQFFGHPLELRVLPRPEFSSFASDFPAGTISFTVLAEPGFSYQVEASHDLTNWVYLADLADFRGSARIVDSEAGSFRARYYRLVIPRP